MEKRRRINDIYKQIAKESGVSVKEVKDNIKETIKAAWNSPIGSKEKELQLRLFPDGKMPTSDEFIYKMAEITVTARKKSDC